MSKVVNDCLDEKIYNTFWNKLQQFKFDLFYYNEHFRFCNNVSKGIKYAIVGMTTGATTVWLSFSENQTITKICGILIIALQIVSAVSELFPYEKRKSELRDVSFELGKIYIDMEDDWRKIQNLELTNSEIKEKIKSYDLKLLETSQHYFKDDALPEKEKLRLNADIKTEEYFNYFFKDV